MNYFIQRVRGCCPPWSTLHYTPPRDQQSIDGAEQLQVKDLFKVLVEQRFPTFQTREPLHQRFQTCGPPLLPEKFFSFHSNFFFNIFVFWLISIFSTRISVISVVSSAISFFSAGLHVKLKTLNKY